MKSADMIKLLDMMNKFDVTTNKTFFVNARRMEKFALNACLVFTILYVIIKFANPFFPISSKEYQHVQAIYDFKYPQNRLPLCFWIPYVDTSEPHWFAILYLVEIHLAMLGFSLGAVQQLIYPFIILHLVGQYLILSHHLNNLDEGQQGVLKHWQKRRKRLSEVFKVRKCIIMHQNLLEFRKLFDSVTERNYRFRMLLLLVITFVSGYPISILSEFNARQRSVLLAEFAIGFWSYYYNCIMSEVLEWANCRIRTSIYQSKWYEMCPEAQRMMLMFLRRTQRPHYICSLGGMLVLGHEIFIVKNLVSFIRFINLRKKSY
ncbi:hypothetical protein WDU94_008657 [Cyamophila willieti]